MRFETHTALGLPVQTRSARVEFLALTFVDVPVRLGRGHLNAASTATAAAT